MTKTALVCSCELWEAPRQTEFLEEQTDGRGGGMFTQGEKELGGLTATGEC